MLWGISLIVGKCIVIVKDRYLFGVDLLESASGDKSDLFNVLSNLETLPTKIRDTPLVRP